ncbi:MAG: hypothetical protein KatS3mg027_2130 [Bacteroidia bacterium]|nr:MAG: hypothetical protein KatS3mg027_2130 [Bacteroidia bacterium]
MYLFSLYIHVITAIIWIGGQLFLPLVLIPALKKIECDNPIKRSIVIETGIVFSKVGKWLMLIFVLTGIGNFYFKFHSFQIEIFQSRYGELLLLKVTLFLIMLAINFYHEIKVGLRMKEYLNNEEYERIRKIASITGRITLLLSLIIAFIGLYITK